MNGYVMRIVAVVLVSLALIAGFSGLVIALNGNVTAADNSVALRQLLLNGKTASVVVARKTAQEVLTLLSIQSQQLRSQRALRTAIGEVERHLDKTIQRAVSEAASRVAREFGR